MVAPSPDPDSDLRAPVLPVVGPGLSSTRASVSHATIRGMNRRSTFVMVVWVMALISIAVVAWETWR